MEKTHLKGQIKTKGMLAPCMTMDACYLVFFCAKEVIF